MDIIERPQYIADNPPCSRGGFHKKAIETAKDAIGEIKRLEKDRERIDWLDKCTGKPDGFWTEFNSCRDIRELIDTTIELMKSGACE